VVIGKRFDQAEDAPLWDYQMITRGILEERENAESDDEYE